jgi:hypothetical protein
MEKAVKRIFFVVSIVAVLACLAVGTMLIFFPDQSATLSSLFTRADSPDAFPPAEAKRIEKVERAVRLATAAPAPETAAPAATAAYHLTEEEINQQIQYELTRRNLPKKGLETVHARLTAGKAQLVCRLNGESFYNSLSPEQQESFPGLLRTRGTLNVWLVPTVDILNRPWVQIEALQMSGIPVPVSLVLPMLKKNLKGVEYDPDYGFRLPERIRRLEVAEKAVDIDLNS